MLKEFLLNLITAFLVYGVFIMFGSFPLWWPISWAVINFILFQSFRYIIG